MSTLLVAALIPPALLGWMHLAESKYYAGFPTLGGDRNVEQLGALSPSLSPYVRPMTTSDWDILVVDDEPDIRTMLRLLLQDEGYRVSEAVDGVTGLAYLRATSRPTIVLLDYKMPRMNGEQLLEAVMEDPHLAKRHAFIFLTANLPAFSSALLRLLAAVTIPVIQKPFEISQILEAIEQAIVRLQASPDHPSP